MKFSQLDDEAQLKAIEFIDLSLESGSFDFSDIGDFISFNKEISIETFKIGDFELPIKFIDGLPDLSFVSTELIMLCNLYEVTKLSKATPEVVNKILFSINSLIGENVNGQTTSCTPLNNLLNAIQKKTKTVFKSLS
jgi:hypothetical protein